MSAKPPRDALQRFIELLLAGCALGLAGLAFVSHLQHGNLQETVDLAARSRDTIDALDSAVRDLADAEAGVRGYLLTGQPSMLGRYLAGVAAAEGDIGDVEQRLDDGAGQRDSLRRLQALGRQKMAELARIVSLHDNRATAEALEVVRGSDGQRLLDDFRSVASTMIAHERTLAAQRTAAARATRDLAQYLSWLTELGIALVFAGGYFVVRRELRARVAATDALLASQRELEASERRIAAMAQALPALIAYVDRAQTYRFTNGNYETFFGEPAGSFVGRSVRDVFGARAYAATKGRIEAVLAGAPQSFERVHERHGRTDHLLLKYVPDRDAEGAVIGFYVMALDITDRKNAETALRVNERRLRAITDNVPAIIAHLDRDHRYLHTNEGFRRLWGADPERLIGRTQREFRGESVEAQLADHLLGVLQGETRRFEVSEVIDGIEHHFQQSLVPDLGPGGDVQGYYSVSFDITDLRRNEKLVIESSARHRSIVEEQSELVSLARPDGELIYVNPAYARHFDLSPAALIGKNLLDLVEPADRAAVRDTVATVIAAGAIRSSENRMISPDGRERWVAWTNTRQLDASGVATLRSVGRDVTEQRRAEQALRASEEFLGRTGRLAGVGGYRIELETGKIVWSREVCRILDVPEDFAPTLETAIGFYAPESQPVIQAAVRRGIETGQSWDLELRLITASGRDIWVRSVGDVESEHGRRARIVGAFQDVTARKRAELAAEHKERLLRAVTDNLPVLAMYVDVRETVRFINATGAAWLGLGKGAALDRPVRELVGPARYASLRQALRRSLRGDTVESEWQDDLAGRRRHLHLVHRPDLQADGSVAGAFVMVADVTAAKEVQHQLEALARVDTLTGLPNRRQFDERLDDALRRCHRGGQRIAVMFLDIDHFKAINDSLGHAGGDAVLTEFGARLKASVRETDVVARLAGDEFVVLLEGLTAEEDAARVACKILQAMRADFDVDGTRLRVTTSLGVGVVSDPMAPPTAAELMMCADKALYEAKRDGRDRFRLSNFGELAAA